MFILNPDRYLLPDYKISPFKTGDIHSNSQLPTDTSVDSYFHKRFHNRSVTYTVNGRSAIHKALKYYNLQKSDTVTILTTTGNFYVSSCVTSEVEKFCVWNRVIDSSTKIILVVHEFGYPYPDLEKLKDHGLPVIEDVAYAFFSDDKDHSIGNVGEFAIYSFPKMFPLQIGGLLVHEKNVAVEEENWEQSELLPYIKNVMSFYLKQEEKIVAARLRHYKGLKSRVEALGLSERFELINGIVPGVFMFRIENEQVDLKGLRDHFFNHGIQCSIFYGERTFFIPLHQDLVDADLDYFIFVLAAFCKNGIKV